MGITSINPASGKPIKTYNEITPEETSLLVTQAQETWRSWRNTTFGQRTQLMKKVGGILRERKEELARLMATEMGKPTASNAKNNANHSKDVTA